MLKVRLEVDDQFIDLADGRKLLIFLLEIIYDEKQRKPNSVTEKDAHQDNLGNAFIVAEKDSS